MVSYNYLVKEKNEVKGKYKIVDRYTGFEIARVADLTLALKLREENKRYDIIDTSCNTKMEF